jgi:hypothetical protein
MAFLPLVALVVDPEMPPPEFRIVEVPHGAFCRFLVHVLAEPEPLGLPRVAIMDQSDQGAIAQPALALKHSRWIYKPCHQMT